jgi:transcriptional regulator with XRE-family HTH domain
MKTKPRLLARDLGSRLKERRLGLGLVQAELAALTGISVHSLSNIESGRANPSLEVLEPLLDCLGLELSLMPRVEPKAPATIPPSQR